jgi:hypothetical protein
MRNGMFAATQKETISLSSSIPLVDAVNLRDTTPLAVPEPSTWALLLTGTLAVISWRRVRSQN